MKVAIIGLGGIAQKAYLPLLASMENIECHLYTRNAQKLKQLSEKYRFPHIHHSLKSVVESEVEAAFVHTSTESHPEIIHYLLENKIAVYVDKPLADHYQKAKSLCELASSRNTLLMVGFNRRFSPLYQSLQKKQEANMILMQKNRAHASEKPRVFVYDDFIHVVDSVRFFLDRNIREMSVHPLWQGDLLQSLTVQFSAEGKTATAIMNRNSGVTEEKAAVMTSEAKYEVENLTALYTYQGTSVSKMRFDDWENTLHKRGFMNIVQSFLSAVKEGKPEPIAKADSLETHRICEQILTFLE